MRTRAEAIAVTTDRRWASASGAGSSSALVETRTASHPQEPSDCRRGTAIMPVGAVIYQSLVIAVTLARLDPALAPAPRLLRAQQAPSQRQRRERPRREHFRAAAQPSDRLQPHAFGERACVFWPFVAPVIRANWRIAATLPRRAAVQSARSTMARSATGSSGGSSVANSENGSSDREPFGRPAPGRRPPRGIGSTLPSHKLWLPHTSLRRV
jgi:hypothetical protein